MREQPGVAAIGVRGPVQPEDLVAYAQKACRIAPTQAVRADRVVGFDHVATAAAHAARAQAEGRAQAERPELEFLRYLAGERQIKKALSKMGVTDGDAVLVGLGDKGRDAVQYLSHALGYREDDGVMDAGKGKLRAFGITARQLEGTDPSRHLDLALEAVAKVDLLRP